MRRLILCTAAAAAVAVSVHAAASGPAGGAGTAGAAGALATRPRIEVTFVLDSTGSMGGLIDGAKQKIWAIANGIIARKPTPDVRIGLVTYRDRGDDYVTRLFDLTDDIDAVFRNLQTFQADGGGDTPESVNQALDDAVNRISWSTDRSVLRLIFLVGDAPPHMDYTDDVKYPVTCQKAAARGLIINTVQCGEASDTRTAWEDIARRAEGSYVALEQSGNMVEVSTPYDDEIARVSGEIGATVIPYGDSARQSEAMAKVSTAAAAPVAVAADRAAFNLASGGKAIQGAGDLVSDTADGVVDLATVQVDQLPPALQKMTPAERSAFVAKQAARRAELNASLEKLSRQRADYVSKELARLSGSGDSFDAKVAEIIAAEASRVK